MKLSILSIFFDKKFFKFIIVGVINTIAGAVVMFALYNFAGLSYWVSSAATYVSCSTLSFFLNKNFTFGVKRKSVAMVFMFAGVVIAAYLIAFGCAKPAMNYFLQNSSQKIRENAALFAGMCVYTGLNYIGQRCFVFKDKT